MITLIDKQKIILRHRAGESNRGIADALGIDKNTVNKYVAEYENEIRRLYDNSGSEDMPLPGSIMEPPRYDTSSRGPQDSTLEAAEIVHECLKENKLKRETGRAKQQMKKTDIHNYLLDQGFTISYSTVKRLCKKFDDAEQIREAFIRQEYLPGDICEFDWGEVSLDINDTGFQRYQMAVFTPAYSNLRFARLYRSQDTAAFQESHVDFFGSIHGVYHTMVYDNMRVAVKKFVGPTEKEPTEALTSMSAYYGFQFRFCNIRSGNEKGHVERSVDMVRRFAFAAPGNDRFDSLEDANRHLLEKCRELNRRVLSDGHIANEYFQQEKEQLMPVPPAMPCFIKRTGCRVDKFSTVTVNNSHYSVPDTMVGKKVDVRIYTNRIRIYAAGSRELIASHERSFDAGSYCLDIFHYLRTLKRKPGALPQSSALMQTDLLVKKIYEDYYTRDSKEFLETLEIIREFGAQEVFDKIQELKKFSINDLSAAKIRTLCESDRKPAPEVPIGRDRLSIKAESTLPMYDELRKFQSSAAREVV